MGYNRDHFTINDFQNTFNMKSKVGFNVTPDIVINSEGFKNSIDYSPEDLDISQSYDRKIKDSQLNYSSDSQMHKESKSSSKLSSAHEFYLFGGNGGDLFSINSKSDTSLSSVSFHKTPSIGLSPTAERGGLSNLFFQSENKFQMHHPPHETINKLKDYNQGLEKSLSMEYFKSKASPSHINEEKSKLQTKRQ